jgi:hypothetical protein
VQIPNATVRDERLSHMARGILAELLSRPDGWEATADDMWRASVAIHGKDSPGRRQFRAAFADLKAHGYLTSGREPLGSGRYGTVLTLADVPHVGMSARPGLSSNTADGTDVPHAGTPDSATDVPPGGTPERPGQTHLFAGRSDVPLSDVPHAGTSKRENGSTNTGRKTGQQPARRGAIPDRLEPLRTALGAAGLGAVAWDIRKISDWERIRIQLDRLGLDLMVKSAVTAARTRGEPDSVIAWIGRWESLPDPQPGAPASPSLPAPLGEVVPLARSRQQQETDDLFDRAMQRAQVRRQQKESS